MSSIICFLIGFTIGIMHKKISIWYIKRAKNYANEVAYGDIKNVFKNL